MSDTSFPLVVDLDGTLTPTDTLIESIIQLFKQSPLNLLRLPIWLLKGRASFKADVAVRSSISVAHIPYRESLLSYLHNEKIKGRRIILATAAHESIAKGVARHLGLFDDMLASDGERNLKGRTKLQAIQSKCGSNFVYAGDSRADIPIWKAARAAILVGVSARWADVIRQNVPIEKEFSEKTNTLASWVRALRIHQWTKNLLLFAPMLAAFAFAETYKLGILLLAFLAFSFAASSTYLVNDLLDLENDRAHPRKRLRPFASGSIRIHHGIFAATAGLGAALLLARSVSVEFLFMLLVYLALTSAYSWVLKEYVLIDVIALSLLYTLRILAGSVAIGLPTSSWLLAFSVFLFLSLALVKRCSELVSLDQIGKEAPRGRDYRVTDLTVLWPLGVGAALCAVLVFGLFISAPETQSRYATPQLLWLVALGLIYWLGRLWVKTSRGEMHDDPVIYALKDRGGRLAILAMMATMLTAHFFDLADAL